VLARVVAQELNDNGFKVVIENRPGAGSNIAAKTVAGAAPDVPGCAGFAAFEFEVLDEHAAVISSARHSVAVETNNFIHISIYLCLKNKRL